MNPHTCSFTMASSDDFSGYADVLRSLPETVDVTKTAASPEMLDAFGDWKAATTALAALLDGRTDEALELLRDRADIAAGTVLHREAKSMGDATIQLEVVAHGLRHAEAAVPSTQPGPWPRTGTAANSGMAGEELVEEGSHQGPMAR